MRSRPGSVGATPTHHPHLHHQRGMGMLGGGGLNSARQHPNHPQQQLLMQRQQHHGLYYGSLGRGGSLPR